MKITKSFTLDGEADEDIIRWLNRQDNASAAVRRAIRDHLERGGVTLVDVYQAVKSLERQMQAGRVTAVPTLALVEEEEEKEWNEPADAAAALDALGK